MGRVARGPGGKGVSVCVFTFDSAEEGEAGSPDMTNRRRAREVEQGLPCTRGTLPVTFTTVTTPVDVLRFVLYSQE